MSSSWQAGNQGRLESIVDALVRRYAHAVERCASHRWLLTFRAPPDDRGVTCTLRDGWALLDAAAGAAAPLALVEQNAALPSWLKLAVFTDGSVHLRAELPVDDDGDPSTCLTAVLSALSGEQIAAAAAAAPAHLSLAELSAEAAWPYVDRPDGRIAVELEVPGVFQQATIDRVPGAIRIVADLGANEAIEGEASRVAVAALLLRVAGAVRMVRVAGDSAVGGLRPSLEVMLPADATPADLGHALTALSVACRLCAREVDVLRRDEAAARAYLECLG